MKTDNYLTLCLEQAAKSPLHYRHGAIVVRGGKVIGQGYNDYRPGFNGGALKHGRIARSALDGEAVKELKTKLKKKDKGKQQQSQQQQQHPSGTFTPFESSGGGPGVNQPLSMHSEMMAIYSALSASSTLSSTTFSREKPCFKLPGSSKRKDRLRRDVLLAYVAAVCQTSSSTGKAQVAQEANRNNNVKEEERNYNNGEEYEEDVALARLSGLAFHEELSGEKHHVQKNQNEKNGKKKGYQYQYQYDRYGSQTQHGQAQAQPSPSNLDGSRGNVIRGYDTTLTKDYGDHDDDDKSTNCAPSHRNVKRKKDYKRSGKMKTSTSTNESPPAQPTLLPKGHSGEHGAKVAERKKNPRLQGADLYVTRMGWTGKPATKPKKASAPSSAGATATDDDITASTSSLSSLSATSSHSASGSLHDELINPNPSPSPAQCSSSEDPFDRKCIHASRPCYRCITFMHSVGIRRVFWTNDAGEWEGGKVSSLVESMDASMDGVANGANGGPMGNGVFITKHEVLMLRRTMGQLVVGKT